MILAGIAALLLSCKFDGTGAQEEFSSFPKISPAATQTLDYFKTKSRLKALDAQSLFGISKEELLSIDFEIGKKAVSQELGWRTGETVQVLSGRISSVAGQIVKRLKNPSPNLESYIHASLIVNWVRSHIKFDARDDAVRRADRTNICDMQDPATVCGGSSWLCACLATFSHKTQINKIEGRLRGSTLPDQTPDHSWEMLVLPTGDMLFADAQHSRLTTDIARGLEGNLRHPLCFALSNEARTLFLAYRYEMNEVIANVDPASQQFFPRFHKFDTDPNSNLRLSEWKGVSTQAIDPVRIFRPNDSLAATWKG